MASTLLPLLLVMAETMHAPVYTVRAPVHEERPPLYELTGGLIDDLPKLSYDLAPLTQVAPLAIASTAGCARKSRRCAGRIEVRAPRAPTTD